MTVYGSTNPQTGSREAGYMCTRKSLGCSKPAYGRARLVDEFVLEAMSYDWEGAADSKMSAEVRYADATAQVRDREATLDELGSLETRRTLGVERWEKMIAEARAELDAALAELDRAEAEVEDPHVLSDAEVVQIGELRTILPKPWDETTIDVKRQEIHRFVTEVRVEKADRRGRWHRLEDRVQIRWVGGGFADSKHLREKRLEAEADDFTGWLRSRGHDVAEEDVQDWARNRAEASKS